MKKTLIYTLLLASTTFLLACSSEDDSLPKASEYYFSFKVNGQAMDYPYQPESQINLTGGLYFDGVNELNIMQLSGSKDIFQPLKNQVVFRLENIEEFKEGTKYTNIPSNGFLVAHSYLFGYYDENGKSFLASKNSPLASLWDSVEIEFSEINANGIKGSFSGTALNYDSSTGMNVLTGKVEITEGKFHVPRNNE
ncbi:hypothetical protein [Algoriphagus winogradskyi]|uniref:Lipoprotein n=1 Tax=Algoriphagus winogradskyi TaxID=237017 RepID=A0ABY1P2Z3_9BACT|nr:hypothetical protein [Algoriphagus winogradskyi]SMP25213.1 hypothetical protein SAMN06265367_104151 [Algoriphagus winogradskyi]